jgi:hypothetical protein
VTLADRQVDRPVRAGHERDRGWPIALARDPQDPMAALHRQVLDVGRARLADPQPVQAEQHRQCLVRAVVAVGGGEEHAELAAVETTSIRGVDLRASNALSRVRADPTVDVGEPVKPAHRREAPVDRRRRELGLAEPGVLERRVHRRGRSSDRGHR